jgi:glycogen operon protein
MANNRDGHGENHSWNCGVEGPTAILRSWPPARPTCALAGHAVCLHRHDHADGGRRVWPQPAGQQQRLLSGQPIGWVDWHARDTALEDHVAALSAARRAAAYAQFRARGTWRRADGAPMEAADWEAPGAGLVAYAFRASKTRAAFCIDCAARRVDIG